MNNIKEAEEQLNRDIEEALLKYHKNSGQTIESLLIDPRFNWRYFGSPQQSMMTCSPVIEIKKII